MSNNQSDESVHVTGEERLHPALRKLGRACIALARWQREQRAAAAEQAGSPQKADALEAPRTAHADANDQEAHDADA